MMTYWAIFVGGGLGSLARFGMSKLIHNPLQGIHPLGTLAANLASTVLLGVLLYWLQPRGGLAPGWKFFWATGFCGGFSTFSTFSFETAELLRSGHWAWAALNALGSMALGVLVVLALSRVPLR